MKRFKQITSLYLILIRDGKILLLRRINTGYEDGKYGLVAGHVDEGESITNAAIREAREESGVGIDLHDLFVKTTMHRKQNDERVDFFFEVTKWSGEIQNAEPHKCDDLRWFPLSDLPLNTIPYIREAIECYQNGIFYSEFGW